MANKINQTFVDTVRATGGNNEQRFLLIAGYNTDITMTCSNKFQMPTDTAKDKLLLSVHYYTPWDYCGTKGRSDWGTKTDYEEQNRLFKNMTKYFAFTAHSAELNVIEHETPFAVCIFVGTVCIQTSARK